MLVISVMLLAMRAIPHQLRIDFRSALDSSCPLYLLTVDSTSGSWLHISVTHNVPKTVSHSCSKSLEFSAIISMRTPYPALTHHPTYTYCLNMFRRHRACIALNSNYCNRFLVSPCCATVFSIPIELRDGWFVCVTNILQLIWGIPSTLYHMILP